MSSLHFCGLVGHCAKVVLGGQRCYLLGDQVQNYPYVPYFTSVEICLFPKIPFLAKLFRS